MVFELPIVTNTSGVGLFALYAGGLALVLVCLLTLQVAWMRFRLLRELRYKRRVQLKWRDYIARSLVGDTCSMPDIIARDIYYLLEEYDYTFGIIKGPELEKIRQSLYQIDLPLSLYELLHSRNIKKRLYALVTLGNLRDRTAWGRIVSCLGEEQAVISLAAARALVLIDPQRAVNEIIPEILARKDWPWANIAHILKLAGPKLVCKKLSEIILQASETQQSSLLRMYKLLQCEEEYPVTVKVLANAMEDKVVSVCLNISLDPDVTHLARENIQHQRWHVRMNAAVALGRFGGKDDVPLLIELLKDPEWWVRYRAAQAILAMPHIDSLFIQKLRANLADRYADDIFVHVLNEGVES